MKWLPPLSSQGHHQIDLFFYCLYLCYKINSCFDKIYPSSATDTLYTVYRHSVVLYFLSFDPRRGRDPLRSTCRVIDFSFLHHLHFLE